MTNTEKRERRRVRVREASDEMAHMRGVRHRKEARAKEAGESKEGKQTTHVFETHSSCEREVLPLTALARAHMPASPIATPYRLQIRKQVRKRKGA